LCSPVHFLSDQLGRVATHKCEIRLRSLRLGIHVYSERSRPPIYGFLIPSPLVLVNWFTVKLRPRAFRQPPESIVYLFRARAPVASRGL